MHPNISTPTTDNKTRTSVLNVDPSDNSSDYGSDFTGEDEQLLIDLLARVAGPGSIGSETLPVRTLSPRVDHRKDETHKFAPDHRPSYDGDLEMEIAAGVDPVAADGRWIEVALERDDPDHSAAARQENSPSKQMEVGQPPQQAEGAPPEEEPSDGRSPLKRFRTAPKKPLSVTDLVSPAWCELQYWYTLTKYGRKPRTAAMKKGSVVHQVLQDQVHRTVPVQTTTREDAWGLRIWNVIHGLRTLRETGTTRELEVWGVLDGAIVVNGVIDELSYDCPDRVLDAEMQAEAAAKEAEAGGVQRTLDHYIRVAETNRELGRDMAGPGAARPTRKVYITDVKTRVSNHSLPSSASLRPTLMQLFIYHRLLSDLASGKVDPDVIFARNRVDPSLPFTDAFIAQVGSLEEDYEVFDDDDVLDNDNDDNVDDDEYGKPTHGPARSLDTLLRHNSLRQLWGLLVESLRETFPHGRLSVGDVLKVEYRRQTDGDVVGERTLLYDDTVLRLYLDEAMRWWKGERAAVGVPVEEAYKCRSCDFADTCSWRNGKIEESIHRHRQRTRSVV